MPSPDITPVVDLTLYDSTASEYADRAAVNVETLLPEASLPVGSLEMVLIESLALLVAELGYAINRIPGAVLESLLTRLYAIPRSPGVLPTGTVVVNAVPEGASVPVGTIVQIAIGDDIVAFTTDSELTIVPGVASATVTITGTEYTDLANGTIVGTAVDFLTDTVGVDSATVSVAVSNGQGPEDADAYLDRAGIRLQRLTDTLVLPSQFEDFALEQQGVYRARAINNYNSVTPAAANGHVSVAVLSPTGTTLSGGAKTALEAVMDAAALANLGVHVFDPTITAVNVVATVTKVAGADSATVQAACVAALDDYLSPLTWGWGATVRRNELIAVLEGVEGVDYVNAGHPTSPSGDTALSGQAPLADLGTATITVV